MSIFMTARFRVRPETLEVCKQAISDFVAYVKDHEPGTQVYLSLQDARDETSFLNYFIFDNEAAREIHSTSAGVKRFTGVLYPNLVADVEFTEYQLFATTEE